MYKYYEAKKNLLVPMKLKNGMYRLVKIPKGKIYRYYTEINRRGKITLCKEVFNKEWLRDVITMPREDFKKYFKEVKKMKHGKRLNFEMKKLLVENGLNPKEWLYVKNLNDKLVLINTKNNTIKELEKWDLIPMKNVIKLC